MTVETPELDKERAVRDKAHAIGEFLEWLGQEGIVLCAQRPTVLGLDVEYHPVDPNPTKLLARHFGHRPAQIRRGAPGDPGRAARTLLDRSIRPDPELEVAKMTAIDAIEPGGSAGGSPEWQVSVGMGWVHVDFAVARGRAVVSTCADGRLEVEVDVRVYGRQVRGLVRLEGSIVRENHVEAVDPERGRLSGRQLDTCGRLAVTYARQARRPVRTAVDDLRAAGRRLRSAGL